MGRSSLGRGISMSIRGHLGGDVPAGVGEVEALEPLEAQEVAQPSVAHALTALHRREHQPQTMHRGEEGSGRPSFPAAAAARGSFGTAGGAQGKLQGMGAITGRAPRSPSLPLDSPRPATAS